MFEVEPWEHDLDGVDGWRLTSTYGAEGHATARDYAITSDSRWLVSAGPAGVALWELATLRRCRWDSPVRRGDTVALGLSADDARLAVSQAEPERVAVVDLPTGELLLELDRSLVADESWPPAAVAFAGDLLLTGHARGHVVGWRIEGDRAEPLWTAEWGNEGRTDAAAPIAVSPDGSRCAWACEEEGAAQFHTATGELERVVVEGCVDLYEAVAFTRDVLLVDGKAYDIETGELRETYGLQVCFESSTPEAVALAGPIVALVDACMCRIEVQRRRDGLWVGELDVPDGFGAQGQLILASRDGRHIVTAARAGLMAWRVVDGESPRVEPVRLLGSPLPFEALRFAGNDTVFASAPGWAVVVSPCERRAATVVACDPSLLGALSTEEGASGRYGAECLVAVSPCGRFAFFGEYAGAPPAGTREHRLVLCDLGSGERRSWGQRELFGAHTNDEVFLVDDVLLVGPGGQRVGFYCDGVLAVFSADPFAELFRVSEHCGVGASAWSADGALLVTGGWHDDDTPDRFGPSASLRDATTGELRWQWRGAPGPGAGDHVSEISVSTLAMDAAAERVAGGTADGRVLLWAAADGRLLRELPAEGAVADVGFDDDGALSVATSAGLQRWSPAGEPLAGVALRLDLSSWGAEVRSTALSPDGRCVAVGTSGGMIVVYHRDDAHGAATQAMARALGRVVPEAALAVAEVASDADAGLALADWWVERLAGDPERVDVPALLAQFRERYAR